MAISPQKVVRGTPVVFEQLFAEDDGTPIVPLDPIAYPAVSIVSPSEEIIQSGVALNAGGGRWRFTWFVPADVDMMGPDNPWRIDWLVVTNGGRQIERQANFIIIDNIEASPDERAYTNLTYVGNTERVLIKFKNAQEVVQVQLIDSANMQTNLTPAVQTVQSDGFYTYYVDTPPLTATGCYLAVWNCRQTAISPTTTMIQQIRVPDMIFWWIQPSLRMLIDKVQKKIGHVQAYSDSDLYEYLVRGAEYVNAVNPITNWTLVNWPSAYGMNNFLLMAAAWWGLNAQYLSEGELAFNFSGQTVTLDVDRTGYYESAMSRLKDYLDSQLQQTKRNMLRRVSVGAIATRPYDFGLQSLVTRVQTVNGGQNQILPLFSRLGLV
jgi:hypothetical protein